ncbi:MAG TPA: hypothetical protein VIL97_09710, partial [Thermoanaerobaculia bacterium]
MTIGALVLLFSAAAFAQIDLGIYDMTDSPDPITLGTGDVQYAVTTYNYSGSQATNAVLTNTIPAGSTFVSATANGGGTCSES